MGRSRAKPDSDESGKTTPSQPDETIKVAPGETATGEATGDGSGTPLPEATPDADGVTRTMFDHDPATGESTPVITQPHDGGPLTEDTAGAEAAQSSFASASDEEKVTLLGLGTTLQPNEGEVQPVLSTKTLDELEAQEVEEARRDAELREAGRRHFGEGPPRPLTKVGKAVFERITELSDANQHVDRDAIVAEVSAKLGQPMTMAELASQEAEAFFEFMSRPPRPDGVKRYKVWSHGPLVHDGQEYKPGEELELPEHVGNTIACLEEA